MKFKGFYLRKDSCGNTIDLYSGVHYLRCFCTELFEKYFPHLKIKPGEKIPVNIKITRKKK